MMLGVIFH